MRPTCPLNGEGFWDLRNRSPRRYGLPYHGDTIWGSRSWDILPRAEASCTTNWVGDFAEADYSHSCPSSSIVRLKFNTDEHGDIALNWYDGGLLPDLPDELKDGETIGDGNGGSIFYGTRGILICDTYSRNARLLPSDTMKLLNPPAPYLKRIEGDIGGHQRNWVEGCLNGTETSSDFKRSGPLTEAVLMGNLAIKAFQYKEFKPGKKAG